MYVPRTVVIGSGIKALDMWFLVNICMYYELADIIGTSDVLIPSTVKALSLKLCL